MAPSEERGVKVAQVSDTLGSNGWSHPYSIVWDTIRSLVEKGQESDPIAVKNELVRINKLDHIGGFDKFAAIIESTPTFDVPRWT